MALHRGRVQRRRRLQQLNAWADGVLVHSITQGSDWTHGPPGLPATWMNGMFNSVFFGWQSFSSAPNEIWMDDLVLSTSRINCTP